MQALTHDNRVVLLGEDICDPYGGAFKVTKGLSSKFPERVINTPICEPSIVGVANGLALRGLLPVVEIMFGDFLTLAADQIVNHMAKFRGMYNKKVSVPVVLRTPMGGYRGYGPTHSQSLEKCFFGTPGIEILAPSIFHNPGRLLLTTILDCQHPVIFVEYKTMYGSKCIEIEGGYFGDYAVRVTDDRCPAFLLSNNEFEEADITIATYGEMLPMLLEACEQLLIKEEIFVEIFLPSRIFPLDLEYLLQSLSRTRRLLVIEEGTTFSGWGSEVLAQAWERSVDILRQPPERIGALETPIPSSTILEEQVLPNSRRIHQTILNMVRS